MMAAACAPCMAGTLKVGAAALAGVLGYSKVKDRKFKNIKTKKKNKGKSKSGGGIKYTKKQKEFIRVCQKVEKNKKLNPGMRSLDCHSMVVQSPKEITWMKNWYQDGLKEKNLDWDKYKKHYSKKNSRKKTKRRNKTRRVRKNN